MGVLRALNEELGWEPAGAAEIVGTSAGSVMGSLLASGVTAEGLMPSSVLAASPVDGGSKYEPDPEWILFELAAQSTYSMSTRALRVPLGSLGLSLSGIRPGLANPLRLISGLAPQGLIPTVAIKNAVRRAPRDGWPRRPHCRVVACDYATGHRVVFGDAGTPAASLEQAVAASCAIPGFFEPERIEGRLYVDGGLHSMSNLDLMGDSDVDLVICLNPMSCVERPWRWGPVQQLTSAVGRLAHWQIRQEAARVRAAGRPVVLFEPSAEDIAAMGHNMMDATRAQDVAWAALNSARRRIREMRRELTPVIAASRGGWATTSRTAAHPSGG